MKTKTIDKKTISELAEYAISFASRKTDGVLDHGHAFMIWYSLENNGVKYVKRAAGFYPVAEKFKLVAIADGQVLDDSDLDIERQLIVQVSSPVFNQALGTETQYKDATFVLAANDCVTLVERVASLIPALKVPSRLIYPTPSLFIEAMFDFN